MARMGITILGLGPGDQKLLTREAWDILQGSREVFLRTSRHPAVAVLPKQVCLHSFDSYFDQSTTIEDVYERIVSTIIELGKGEAGVVYAVPGDPLIAEATTPEIIRRGEAAGLPVHIVPGLSFIEPLCSALKINLLPKSIFLDAFELAPLYIPPFPPNFPTIITHIHSREIASQVKLALMGLYPDKHLVKLVHAAGSVDERVEALKLYEIDRSHFNGPLTCLYVPPLENQTSFEAFLEVIARLRAPDGCPWDRQQDYKSLRSDLLEETYEALEALDAEDPQSLCEELGDMVLLILLLTHIASEAGDFTVSDVLQGIHNKIVFRHPHVFDKMPVSTEQDVVRNWEKLKAEERSKNGKDKQSLLDGVSHALPALTQAQIYQKRAARVGFDWPDLQGVLEKFQEELDELKAAETGEQRSKEIGDLLFSVVNLARWSGVDAESTLRETNARFYQRFTYIEKKTREQGRQLQDMSLDEMETLWQEAKRANSSS